MSGLTHAYDMQIPQIKMDYVIDCYTSGKFYAEPLKGSLSKIVIRTCVRHAIIAFQNPRKELRSVTQRRTFKIGFNECYVYFAPILCYFWLIKPPCMFIYLTILHTFLVCLASTAITVLKVQKY